MRHLTIFIILMALCIGQLFARENDPFTQRHLYEDKLPDFLEPLDIKTNDLLDVAVKQFNKNHCANNYGKAKVHRLMAFHVYRYLASEHDEEHVPKVPEKLDLAYALSKKGLGPLQHWVREEADRKYVINVTDNIYSKAYFLPDRYFSTFTVHVDDILVGPDKFDHFFDQGYSYYLISKFGRYDKKAVDSGVYGEYGYFGLKASGVFSFADLKSNWDGYVFYKKMFEKVDDREPLFAMNTFGCVRKTRPFSWSHWISWQWDELWNPSFYKASILKKVKENISRHMKKHDYCRSYAFSEMKGAYHYLDKRTDEYLNRNVPRVVNTFNIAPMCTGKNKHLGYTEKHSGLGGKEKKGRQ